jgi:D-glycerate 3-kinase
VSADTRAAAIACIARALDATTAPLLIGIAGSQGSGKSTLSDALDAHFRRAGHASAILSIDDLYLPRSARQRLAREVHPLLATRGVPGTHDIALGLDILAGFDAHRPLLLPRFDKAEDDRHPASQWEQTPPLDLLILEGWCVGARPEPDAALAAPINRLEREEDAQGVWRRHAHGALAGAYQTLFGRIDRLLFLAAPGFDTVLGWRIQQEQALRTRGGGAHVMDDTAIARFIAHYERLTRHMLREMPDRANLLVRLDANRAATSIEARR